LLHQALGDLDGKVMPARLARGGEGGVLVVDELAPEPEPEPEP